jgi:23S rRNA (cytidine1920-2'-O)/16S rRNA (cytidine1409-2'-O)-methyltransferase
VRDPKIHVAVLEKIAHFAQDAGFTLKNASFSPITGGEGNIEFLFHLLAERSEEPVFKYEQLKNLVNEAHESLT